MIILQLLLYCTVFTLMVKAGVGNNALNGLYFYPKAVQEKVYELGLTDRQTVQQKKKVFMTAFFIVMLAVLLLIIGLWNSVVDFPDAYLQALLFLEVMNWYDGIVIDRLWVGHSKFWIRQVDNGSCRGYNLDFPDVIKIRNDLLPAGDREKNIPCDLNDSSWFNEIDGTEGAVFFAAGVFYYFRTEDVIRLFDKMAEHFPGGILVFDACNKRGVKLMLKTWIKEADIKDVGAYFAVKDAEKELLPRSSHFAEVSRKSYMRGYRNIDKSIRPLYCLLNTLCDRLINMQIVKIRFR